MLIKVYCIRISAVIADKTVCLKLISVNYINDINIYFFGGTYLYFKLISIFE